jgi:hypothetical protein
MTLVYARIADRVVADEYESVCQQIDALYNTAATPASASETPSITPSADAVRPGWRSAGWAEATLGSHVRASASKLAVPMPATPWLSQRPSTSVASAVDIDAS